MPEYREGFVRLLYAVIVAQFIVIAILLGGFSTTYLSNDYFRIWVNDNFPQLGLLLTGQFDALLIGVAAGGTMLLIQWMKKETKTDQRKILTAVQALASMETTEPLPNYATRTKKREVARETPEQVLGELEKQDL